MSSEKHANLGLHKWAATDGVLRTEFNDNFGKIDEKVTEVTAGLGDLALIPENTVVDAVVGLNKKNEGFVSVTQFGVIGDEAVDDSDKILEAIAFAKDNKKDLLFPKVTGYKTTKTIVIPSGVGVVMESPIIYYGTLNEPCLVVGEKGVNNNNRKFVLQAKRKSYSDWMDENCIGIQIINAYASDIEILNSNNFTIGVQLLGASKGLSYNNINLYELLNNKYAIDCSNENSGTGSGWCNENNFFGGRFACFSGIGSNKSRYGIRITSKDGTYANNNNNIFTKPSFELNKTVAGTAEAIPILVEYGVLNQFNYCRSEGNEATFAKVLNQSTENSFSISYGQGDIVDKSTAPVSFLSQKRLQKVNNVQSSVFDSGALHKKACYYDGSTTVHIPNVHMCLYTQTTTRSNYTGITLNDNYLDLNNQVGIGVFIDTSLTKEFVIKKDVEVGYEGRYYIVCYDGAGAILNDVGLNHPYVKGTSAHSLAFHTNFGGSYRTGSDSKEDLYINLHTDVKKIRVLLYKGTNNLRIRSFGVNALNNNHPTSWTDYEEVVSGSSIGTAAPTVGTWKRGRKVYNATPTAGGYEGWVCIADGTPGTWKGFGLIEV
ncbi:hypothetical protein [Peribacillus butanolivorans]|uniref:Pectate lyase superfamily protein domain-containing protein n=1 Tax=Peribacillus butanolivorans TaxID=421767 RepID=A0ABM6XMZ7_9BACI|nr:hypothetical protein [Peribacillus butanolivorans]AXN39867.1 hypothetical protein DTO10_16865 [Peribacillus butanolivorans]